MNKSARKAVNLSVLQRHDPHISDILDSSSYVVVYKFDEDSQAWVRPFPFSVGSHCWLFVVACKEADPCSLQRSINSCHINTLLSFFFVGCILLPCDIRSRCSSVFANCLACSFNVAFLRLPLLLYLALSSLSLSVAFALCAFYSCRQRRV